MEAEPMPPVDLIRHVEELQNQFEVYEFHVSMQAFSRIQSLLLKPGFNGIHLTHLL
jgi:hypothetical protein